jgi:C4-dicarboxylate-specific signal transduction histidine kinase
LAEAEVRRGNERVDAPRATRKTKKQLDRALKNVPQNQRKQLETAINAWQRSKDREVDTLRREVELYRTLSTAGITAATFAHESTGNPLKVITLALNSIDTRGKRDLGATNYTKSLAEPVAMIRRSLGSLNVLGVATLRLLEGTKRRVGRVEVYNSMKSVVTVFQPFFEGRQVEIDLQLAKGGPYLRGTEASIESIVTNLLNNSLSAFESSAVKQRRIEVKTFLQDRTLIIEVLDNGPGISGIEKDEIWLPGYTTRKGGTGLGLTIVRDITKDLGGSVAVEEKGALGGATFRITLPILGA